MKKFIKRKIDRLMFKLGYMPRDGFANTMVELAKESARRSGQMLEYDFGWSIVKIAMKDIYHL